MSLPAVLLTLESQKPQTLLAACGCKTAVM